MALRANLKTTIITIILICIMTVPNISFANFNFISTSSAEEPRPLGPTIYHSFDEMETELFQIASDHPTITKLESIGKTYEGREIWAMKVSDNPDIEEDEPEIFYNAMHHAREWLTMEVALYILNYLTDNYLSNSTITDIVDSRQIWIISCVNPDGRVWDSAGDDPTSHRSQTAGWRKNRADHGEGSIGVDLNRNYGYMWGGAGASRNPGSETYRGPEPFSELETRAIRDFVSQHDFVFAISYHAHGQMILYPYGYTYNDPAEEEIFVKIGENMDGLITNNAGSVNSSYAVKQGSDLYLTSGTDNDWLYGQMGIYAYTIELYPHGDDDDAAIKIPYDRFHPREDKVIPVCIVHCPNCRQSKPGVRLSCVTFHKSFFAVNQPDRNRYLPHNHYKRRSHRGSLQYRNINNFWLDNQHQSHSNICIIRIFLGADINSYSAPWNFRWSVPNLGECHIIYKQLDYSFFESYCSGTIL
jgi:hypothetical protein